MDEFNHSQALRIRNHSLVGMSLRLRLNGVLRRVEVRKSARIHGKKRSFYRRFWTDDLLGWHEVCTRRHKNFFLVGFIEFQSRWVVRSFPTSITVMDWDHILELVSC